MTAKEILDLARGIDTRINSKLEALCYLNSLATKCTATYSDMPRNPNCGSSGMEDTILKIIDLKHCINENIDTLVDLKIIINKMIASVDNREYASLLELRYICFKSWEQIAVIMGYTIRYVHKLHNSALECCEVPDEYKNLKKEDI